MKTKRKGYKTQVQQNEATKRYLDNNPDKRLKYKISNYKSNCKLFLREYAEAEDIREIEEIINDRKKFLKNNNNNIIENDDSSNFYNKIISVCDVCRSKKIDFINYIPDNVRQQKQAEEEKKKAEEQLKKE